MAIELRHINKTFGMNRVLHDVSVVAESGKMTALLGPSGCGKTTLLRIIAGLEFADESPETRILFDGVSAKELPVNRRNVGFVFQHYALFRHMSVFENIAFGLKVKPRRERPSKTEIRDRVNELLELIQLPGLGDRYPDSLSGGQRQRVAFARALAIRPRVLLLDEPFGALDAQVRTELRRWLRRLHETMELTSILVTHDQEEALEVSDSLVVMNRGVVEQSGSASEVFRNPVNEFVMNFLGEVNVFYGSLGQGRAYFSGDPGVPADGGEVRMLVRPHDFEVHKTPDRGGVPARISRILPAGALVKIELVDSRKNLLHVHLSPADFELTPVAPGETVYLVPKVSRIFSNDQNWYGDYVI